MTILTPLDVLDAMHSAAVARAAAELATLNNALQTASDDPRPAFGEAASRIAEDLTNTRGLVASLAVLIAELTPPAPEVTP